MKKPKTFQSRFTKTFYHLLLTRTVIPRDICVICRPCYFYTFCNLLFTGRRFNRKSRWSVQNLLRLSCPEIGADDGALLDTSNATTPVSRRTAVDDGVVAVT